MVDDVETVVVLLVGTVVVVTVGTDIAVGDAETVVVPTVVFINGALTVAADGVLVVI